MIKVTPLGGLGEIGSNMVCWNDGTTGFIIDCGILFPYEEVFEINYLIPAFTHLDKNFYKDIIITHAHEDHIGAIAHVVQWNPEITIHATNYTKHMIMKKLNELKDFDAELKHHIEQKISIDLDDGVKVNYGKFAKLLAEAKKVTGNKE